MPQVPLVVKLPWLRHNDPSVVHWKKSLPFAKSAQGFLLHRVSSARSHMRYTYPVNKRHHDSATFMCGNSTCHPTFYEVPAVGLLVCEKCERAAKQNGLPSADTLVGHHVHIGRSRAKQVCCVGSND